MIVVSPAGISMPSIAPPSSPEPKVEAAAPKAPLKLKKVKR